MASHQPSVVQPSPVVVSTPFNVNSPPPALPDSKDVETFDYSQRAQWLRAAVLGAVRTLTMLPSLSFPHLSRKMSSQGPPAAAAAQSNATVHGLKSPDTVVTIPELSEGKEKTPFDYSQPAQWIRAAVLGANDGLVFVSSLMLGICAVNQASQAMVFGLAGLVAGACSMAIGEFVFVYSQLERKKKAFSGKADDGAEMLPNLLQAAGVSALGFAVGGVLPLLAGGFIGPHWVRMGVVLAVSSLELAGFGVADAVLGGSPVARSTVKGIVGGWAAMLVTFGVLRLFSLAFKTSVVG